MRELLSSLGLGKIPSPGCGCGEELVVVVEPDGRARTRCMGCGEQGRAVRVATKASDPLR